MRIGGIEAGGTKMVCAIGEVQTDKGQPGENQVTITERVTIPREAQDYPAAHGCVF